MQPIDSAAVWKIGVDGSYRSIARLKLFSQLFKTKLIGIVLYAMETLDNFGIPTGLSNDERSDELAILS